jgi:hypothetical protein
VKLKLSPHKKRVFFIHFASLLCVCGERRSEKSIHFGVARATQREKKDYFFVKKEKQRKTQSFSFALREVRKKSFVRERKKKRKF